MIPSPSPTEPTNVRLPIVIFPKAPEGPLRSALPLEHTEVNARITGLLARVTVTQRFTNPLQEAADLEYLFPLPEGAAITGFTLQIGSRQITGEVQEREAARGAYDAARQGGRRAGLFEQRRPNLFAVELSNVQPVEALTASVQYQQRLAYREDALEFVYPMGLTPKYDSPTHPREGEGVHAPVAPAGEKVGLVEITVSVDSALSSGDPHSPSHTITSATPGEGGLEIRLKGPEIPDHDFVLRLPAVSNTASAAAWTSGEAGKEVFLAALLPPPMEGVEDGSPATEAREFIFVLDRSGSMSGEPVIQARNALRACLRALNPGDTFRILLFDDQFEWFNAEPQPATQAAVDRADAYLDAVQGRGGTEITGALHAALTLPAGPERVRYVVFLTDGAVSAEGRTLELLRKHIGAARLFAFGIGPSVNRALLNRMAALGRGQASFLQIDEDIEGAIIRFQDSVSFPMLTDLTLEWESAKAWDVYPSRLPDLYAGEPLEITGKLARRGSSAALTVRGKRGGQPVTLRLLLPEPAQEDLAIARVWAKERIDELLDEAQLDPQRSELLRGEIIGLAMEHDLVTPYTSFVAIDTEKTTGASKKIEVSQPLPKGLLMESFLPPVQPAYLRATAAPTSVAMNRMGGGRKQAFAARLFQESAGAPPPDAMMAAQSVPQPQRAQQPLDRESALRLLARTQKMDGSWEGDVEQTAAALLAFVRSGHTTRSGSFRQALRRAAAWLAVNRGQGFASFARARALSDLEDSSAAVRRLELAKFELPDPATQLERAAVGEPLPPPPAIHSLDDLRLAALINAPLPVPGSLRNGPNPNLVLAWSAALPPVSAEKQPQE